MSVKPSYLICGCHYVPFCLLVRFSSPYLKLGVSETHINLMILAAMTVFIIERQFAKAALWSLLAAALAWVGLMHSYQWSIGDTVLHLGWGAGWQWTIGYVLLGILLFSAQWQKPS